MGKIRIDKNKVTMSNYHLKDKTLSLKAKGLMSWMLSNPDNWDYTIERIMDYVKEGRDAVSSAIRELEAHGYLTRVRLRDNGLYAGIDYILKENPYKKPWEL